MKKLVGALGVFSMLALSASAAMAKCTLTLEFKNTGSAQIRVIGSESQVRVNGGTWSKMNFNDVTLASGEQKVSSWTTNMSCSGNSKRDFRIKFENTATNVIFSNTAKNDIDITDGQRLHWDLTAN